MIERFKIRLTFFLNCTFKVALLLFLSWTCYVNNRELDILAAKGAGIHACLFCPEPRETAADCRIRDFTELDALVGLE